MTDHLRKYESLFTLTPQRMRMIVDAFEETLDKGLAEYDQVVVSGVPISFRRFNG
jgi:hexokinase